jgi:hypothetical protein
LCWVERHGVSGGGGWCGILHWNRQSVVDLHLGVVRKLPGDVGRSG